MALSSASSLSADVSTSRRRVFMKSASYGDAVVKSLHTLQKEDELCDFTIAAEGKSFRVHKILLAGMSDYFRALLLGGPMREQQESHVDLKALSAKSVENMVDFLYSGTMHLDCDNLIEVLTAASHLQISTALDLCSDYIISRLTFSNADDFLHVADTYTLNRVIEFYTNKVLTKFPEFTKTEQFLAVSVSDLSRYLRDDKLHVHSERAIYDVVARWFQHDQSRIKSLNDVLLHIRFGLMTDAQLVQLTQHWLTTSFPPAMKYINDGRKYHYEVPRGHPTLTTSSQVRSLHDDLVFIHQGSSFKPFEVTAYDHKQDKFFQLCTDNSGSRDCRVASVDNFVYIPRVVDCGGGSLMTSLLRFDPRHMTCVQLAPCPRLRIDPALTAANRCLYLFGGQTDTFIVLDSVDCYSVLTNQWVEIRPLPVPTHSLAVTTAADAAGVPHGAAMIFISGGLERHAQSPVSTVMLYDTQQGVYTAKASMNYARRLHEMVCLGEHMYVLGGTGDQSVGGSQIPIERYSFVADQWTILSTTLAGRAVGHFVTLNARLLSIGREQSDATEEEIRAYDEDEMLWKPYARVPRRSGLSGVTVAKLRINFHDERAARHVISDKR